MDKSINKSQYQKDAKASSLLPTSLNQTKLGHSIQKVAEKRKYSQLLAETELPKSTNITMEHVNDTTGDQQFLEKTFLQKHLWKNPSFLSDTLQDFYINPDEKGRPRSELSELNHWPFQTKTERAVIQDILLMLVDIESASFVKNDQSLFEKRVPIQLTHVSPEALAHTIHKFIALSNTIFTISTNSKTLRTNFSTTVVEGYLECLDEYVIEYRNFIEDIQCIFLKQANQGSRV